MNTLPTVPSAGPYGPPEGPPIGGMAPPAPSPPWYRRPLFVVPMVLVLAIAAFLVVRSVAGGGGPAVEGVVARDGQPVSGLTVELLPGTGEDEAATTDVSDPIDTATTDANGRFSFDAPSGVYDISVQVPVEGLGGCMALMPSVTVASGSTADADFNLPTEGSGLDFVDGEFWYVCFSS